MLDSLYTLLYLSIRDSRVEIRAYVNWIGIAPFTHALCLSRFTTVFSTLVEQCSSMPDNALVNRVDLSKVVRYPNWLAA